jgi:hypothetical protein
MMPLFWQILKPEIMIQLINDVPRNMVGFLATGDVDETDFKTTVIPKVRELVKRTGLLNYMLVLDTSVRNFSMGAWIQDAFMGIKHMCHWNRTAIVTDVKSISRFTKIFSAIMPGEFRAFKRQDIMKAVEWASGG